MFHLLRNCNLLAPEALGVRDLLVAGERIAWLGKAGEPLPSWLPVKLTDLEGRTVIPALIDQHVHLTGGGGETGAGSRIPPLSPCTFLDAGIGTVVGVLGTDDTTRSTGDLVAWTRELRAAGLSAYCHTGGYHLPPTTLTGSVRGDIVWIDVIIGVGEIAISDHRSSEPTVAELLRVASDAHVAGLMTGKAGITHLHVGDGDRGLELIRQALERGDLPARAFNPTHVNRRCALFDEAVKLARVGCTIDLTAFPVEPDDDGYPAHEALARYLEAGAPANRVTVSSDGGGCLPRFDAERRPIGMQVAQPRAILDCLRATIRAGVDPVLALPAFTRNVAELLRLPRKGRIEPGADADLLVVDENFAVCETMIRGQWRLRQGQSMPPGAAG